MEGQSGPRCAAFAAAMEILGKPWNGLVLRALEAGPLRFSALSERVASGDRMLSCRLKELEAAGLVERTVDPGPPVRVSYALTSLGHGLFEVMRAVESWGERLLVERGPKGETCDAGGETCAGYGPDDSSAAG